MNLRIATKADAPALAAMIEHFNSDYRAITVTPEQAAARLAATAGVETTIIAEVGGQPAGFACLRVVPYMSDDTPYAEVSDLFVERAFRRRGVGRALIERCEQLARERGAAEVVLITGHDNMMAQALYRSVGYGDYGLALRKRLAPGED